MNVSLDKEVPIYTFCKSSGLCVCPDQDSGYGPQMQTRFTVARLCALQVFLFRSATDICALFSSVDTLTQCAKWSQFVFQHVLEV